jgi:hypothetical protein
MANGNGARHFRVEHSDLFHDQWAELEARFPRLGRVRSILHKQFEKVPTYRAQHIGGLTWLYKTRGGHGVPSLYVYYEVDNETSEVLLQAVQTG